MTTELSPEERAWIEYRNRYLLMMGGNRRQLRKREFIAAYRMALLSDAHPGDDEEVQGVEKDELAQALWMFDWLGEAEQGLRVWTTLSADLTPKRTYLTKAERLIEQGWARVASLGGSDAHPGDDEPTWADAVATVEDVFEDTHWGDGEVQEALHRLRDHIRARLAHDPHAARAAGETGEVERRG